MDFNRHSILVIVANACVLKKTSDLLAATGAAVYGTDCGQEGLRLLRTHLPDLIVMDHALSAPYRLQARDRTWGSARIPVLFLSVLQAGYLESDNLGGGANACITMPFEPEVLLAHARAALQSQRPSAPPPYRVARRGRGLSALGHRALAFCA